MGAGKGKNKRTQTKTTHKTTNTQPHHTVNYNAQKWTDFTTTVKIEKTTLDQYYTGGSMDGQSWLDDTIAHPGYEKIYNELFADAVTVGAITLPNPYTVQDFHFELFNKYDPELKTDITNVKVVLTSNPTIQTILNPEDELAYNDEITSTWVNTTLKNFAEELQKMIEFSNTPS